MCRSKVAINGAIAAAAKPSPNGQANRRMSVIVRSRWEISIINPETLNRTTAILMISEKMPIATIVSAASVRLRRGLAVASLMAKNSNMAIEIVNAPKSVPGPRILEARSAPVRKMQTAATEQETIQTRVAPSSFTFSVLRAKIPEVLRRARRHMIVFHIRPYRFISFKLGEHRHHGHIDHLVTAVELPGLATGQRRQLCKIVCSPGIIPDDECVNWRVCLREPPRIIFGLKRVAPAHGLNRGATVREVRLLRSSPHQMYPRR